MEKTLKRFPVASKIILNKLDDETLARSKIASQGMFAFLENERFYWVRIIKKHCKQFGGFQKSWNQIIKKSSIDVVKELVIAIHKYIKSEE